MIVFLTKHLFTWGPDLSGTLQGAGGVGGLLAVMSSDMDDRIVPVNLAVHYPACDANGNVTAYLDANGVAVAAFEYDAFGNTVSESVAPGVHLPYRFSTKHRDAETGLYFYGHRLYSPELQRWLSRDPIGDFSFFLIMSRESFGRFADWFPLSGMRSQNMWWNWSEDYDW